jgi:hypothetical protein
MEKSPYWRSNIRSPVMKSLASMETTSSLPCSEKPSLSPPVPRKSSSQPPTLFLFHLRLDLLCGGLKFSRSESISHPRYIPTVFGQVSGLSLYDKRADRKWQPMFVTDEICPESIRPSWISREPVAWPWCNLAFSQRRPYCASVKIHSLGTSQSAVRRRWLNLCTVGPSHSQISLSNTILALGKAVSRREPNLGCRGADRPGW